MVRCSELLRWCVLLILLAALVILAIPACQSGGNVVAPQPGAAQPDFALPLPSELDRRLSYADADRIRLGQEFDLALPTNLVMPAESYLVFAPVCNPETDPSYTGLAYAMYNFNLAGYTDEPVIAYKWLALNVDSQNLYLGVANWDLNVWEWWPCDATGLLALPSIEPYLNPSGRVLVTMAAYDPDQTDSMVAYNALQYVRIGPRVGRWVVEIVDDTAVVAMLSLSLDGYDLPRIAYLDYQLGDSALKYARPGFGWALEVLDDVGDTGFYPSMVMIPHAEAPGLYPRICYFSITDNCLMLASCIPREIAPGDVYSEEWFIDPLPIAAAHACSIAADGTDIKIAYHGCDDLALHYVYHNGLAWIDQVVDGSATMGFSNSLCLNNLGQPCISYYDADATCLRYAEYADLAWSYATPDAGSGEDVGQVSSMALGPDGYPQISYNDRTHDQTRWAYFDGSAWHQEVVFDLEAHSEANALVVDADGVPHIACTDSDHNNLMHFWRDPDTDAWFGQTIDSGGSHANGYCVSMAISSDGRLHIAFGGYGGVGAENALKFAYQVD